MEKIGKIKKELERLKEETPIGLSEHENGVEQGRMEIINALFVLLDSMQEEPVSEDLEKELSAYVNSKEYTNSIGSSGLLLIARHFAQWQKEQMMAKAIDTTIKQGCTDLGIFIKGLDKTKFSFGDRVKVIVIKEN